MKQIASSLFCAILTFTALAPAASVIAANSILVDAPKGALLKLTKIGQPSCGSVDWDSVRQGGDFTASGKHLSMKEKKLPLTRAQWQALLTQVVGKQKEITIAHEWSEPASGLAAAIRVAHDIRSHGGKAWVLNGKAGKLPTMAQCKGEYQFTGKPAKLYMTGQEFWKNLERGVFLDARGDVADTPAGYTWVVGSPRKAKRVEPDALVVNGKVDRNPEQCAYFEDVSVVGCDSVHKSMLAMEVARYKNCASQPNVMPELGLSGYSRDEQLAKKIWGEDVALNPKRSGNWAVR